MRKKLTAQSIKICLVTICSLGIFAISADAQKKINADNTPFHKGSKTVGLFVGTGVSYYGDASVPFVFGATYDQGFFDNVGPGNIGIGGVLGYRTSNSKYLNYTYSGILIGVRGTYHLTLLADKNNKFDPYAGVTIGVSINDDDGYAGSNINNVSSITGAFIGAKYNFSPGVGVFAEAGYDYSFIRAGVNFNF